MHALRSRKQLLPARAPPSDSAHSPSKGQALGGKAPTTPPAPAPRLVPKRIRGQQVASRPASSKCAQGCLLKDPDHTGLCITEQGLSPPCVKAAWKQSKLNLPSQKRRAVAFPQLGDAPGPPAE